MKTYEMTLLEEFESNMPTWTANDYIQAMGNSYDSYDSYDSSPVWNVWGDSLMAKIQVSKTSDLNSNLGSPAI